MKVVVDASVILAVVMGEPERDWAIAVTRDSEAFGPRSLPFEIGNALTSLVKRRRLPADNLENAWKAASKFAVVLNDIDIAAAVRLSGLHKIYAYDGYMLQCALEAGASLVTLDRQLAEIARKIGLKVVEN